MKTFAYPEDPYRNPLHNACCGTLKVKLASESETGHNTEICTVNLPLHFYLGGFFLYPMIAKHWRKSTNHRVRKPDKNSDSAFGTNFRISKGFYISMHHCTIFMRGGGYILFLVCMGANLADTFSYMPIIQT